MQFSVPQFIDVEDKIFGNFTFKQFVYMLGGVGLGYLGYSWLPSFIGVPLAAIVLAFALALAFYKYNDRPFVVLLESAFYFLIRSKLYLWKRRTEDGAPEDLDPNAPNSQSTVPVSVPTLSDSKLKQLSWSLDINEYVERANRK
jgi:hypothetical protein